MVYERVIRLIDYAALLFTSAFVSITSSRCAIVMQRRTTTQSSFHQSSGKVANQLHIGHAVNGNLVMQILQRHSHELPGLYSSGTRYDEADIKIPGGVFNLIDRALSLRST